MRRDLIAVVTLLALFAAFVGRSWLAWGHLDFDYGREMVVPMRVAMGDVLYRDVRFAYGPFSPYLHATGYLVFGLHLNVLYGSGLLFSALAVIASYAVARQLSSVVVAWAAAALVTVDLMFFPGDTSHFSFIFPYAYAALHGLVFVLLALACALRALRDGRVGWMALVGVFVGLAALTKQEAGLVGLGIAAVLSAGRLLREGRAGLAGIGVLWAGSLVVPVFGYGTLSYWTGATTIWTRGLFDPVYFGWPLSWLILGFRPGASPYEMLGVLAASHARGIPWYAGAAAIVVAAAYARGRSHHEAASRATVVAVTTVGIAVGAFVALSVQFWGGIPLHTGTALSSRYVALPGLLLGWLGVETGLVARSLLSHHRPSVENLRRWLAVAVGLVMLVRVPASLVPNNYANFALPVGIVLAVCLLAELLPRALARHGGNPLLARAAALGLVAALTVANGIGRWVVWQLRTEPLVTPRGELRLPAVGPRLAVYRRALELIRSETAPDDPILAIPAETALYFLSGRTNHVYETGLLARLATRAEELAYIEELEADPPRLVLLSNRPEIEYGRVGIGIDYGHRLHDWIEANYSHAETIGSRFRIEVWRPKTGSSPAPQGIEVVENVLYDEKDGRALQLDIHRPDRGSSPSPVLLFLHGGGWQFGSRRDAFPDAERAPQSVQGARSWPSMLPYVQAGLAVVTPEYRLSPDARAPAAVEDVRAAFEWILKNGTDYGLDVTRIAVIGVSAGGHLALMLAFTEPGLDTIAGVVDLYGPTDLTELIAGSARRGWASQWIGPPPGRADRARRLSPIDRVTAGAPPVLIIHSAQDTVVPYAQATRLRTALRSAGVPVELVTLPQAQHGFMTDEEQAVVRRAVLAFLRQIGLLGDRDGRAEPRREASTR